MNREVRRLLVQFVDGAFLLVLAIIIAHADAAGVSVFDLMLDVAFAAILVAWVEQIWWCWRRYWP